MGTIAIKHLLSAIATVLDLVLNIYMWLIIARALLSWVNPDPYNPIVRFLYNVTEPALSFLRRRVPVVFGGMDLSPLIIIAAIMFLRIFLVQTLQDWAQLIH